MYRADDVIVDLTWWEKFLALIQSKRAIAALAGVLMMFFSPAMGLDEDLAITIVEAIVAMIIGDSIRPIQDLLSSRRFWVFVAAILTVIASAAGLGIPAETVQTVVLAIAAWIVGDSWRVTMTKGRMLGRK
jgi:hypothetical protein